MKIYILTEGGKEKGFGHIARCVPVYQVLADKGVDLEFLIDGDESVFAILGNSKFQLLSWNSDISLLEKTVGNADLVILDSLRIQKEAYQTLLKYASKLAVIDDLQLRPYVDNEIIIDWFLYAENNKFYQGKNCILGTKYVPLRKDFWNVPDKIINEDLKEIVITLGGTDYRNMAPRFINMLKKRFPEKKVYLFVAKGFTNKQQIKELQYNNLIIHPEPDDQVMMETCLQADLAIATGGHTINELARIGIPTIHFLVVDNQYNAENWKLTGFTRFVGWWNEGDIIDKVAETIAVLHNKKHRLQMSTAGKKMVDGKGVFRLVDELLERVS